MWGFARRSSQVRCSSPPWPSAFALGLILLGTLAGVPLRADEPPPRIRLEVGKGPFYVGQGIDLVVTVSAGDQRPALELPQPADAAIWVVDTAFQPLSVSAIGPVMTGSNLFVTRLRLVARRAGTLRLPPFVARSGGRTGRTPAATLSIEPVPLEGRPGGFLGGVGEFSVHAAASPASVVVGQELVYRIDITGPAAWGTTSRPELERLTRLPIAPVVEPLDDEATHEPPRKTFFWRIRPTRAGSAVLPPVAITAFEPRTRRFITRVSPGTPIRVAAAPQPVADAIVEAPALPRPNRVAIWVGAALALPVLGGATGVVLLLRRWGRTPRKGPAAASRFARAAAARWGNRDVPPTPSAAEELARRILADLVEYARVGSGRPPGALTPAEAGAAVLQITGQTELASQAAALIEDCDRTLFAGRPDEERAAKLRDEARRLLAALGRAPHREAASHESSRRVQLSGSAISGATSRMSG